MKARPRPEFSTCNVLKFKKKSQTSKKGRDTKSFDAAAELMDSYRAFVIGNQPKVKPSCVFYNARTKKASNKTFDEKLSLPVLIHYHLTGEEVKFRAWYIVTNIRTLCRNSQ